MTTCALGSRPRVRAYLPREVVGMGFGELGRRDQLEISLTGLKWQLRPRRHGMKIGLPTRSSA